MLEDYTVSVFPANECQALALLYVKSQDLTGKTPEEIADAYTDAYQRIVKRNKQIADLQYEEV